MKTKAATCTRKVCRRLAERRPQKRPHTGYVDAGEDIYSEEIAAHTKARTIRRVDEAFHGCQRFSLSALGKTVLETAVNYSLLF